MSRAPKRARRRKTNEAYDVRQLRIAFPDEKAEQPTEESRPDARERTDEESRREPRPEVREFPVLEDHPANTARIDPTQAPKLLSIQEASYLVQVPVKTLYKWHADGKLKGIAKRVGKQLRLDRDALLRLWANGKKATN